jgi:hypothetical protein
MWKSFKFLVDSSDQWIDFNSCTVHAYTHKFILNILRDSRVHRPARSPLRMSVITAAHSSIQLIPGMLMGRVPPSGLIISFPPGREVNSKDTLKAISNQLKLFLLQVATTSCLDIRSLIHQLETPEYPYPQELHLRGRCTGRGRLLWLEGCRVSGFLFYTRIKPVAPSTGYCWWRRVRIPPP